MMKITPAGLRFYCVWHWARKKRLHSQLLEFLNTNNILRDQWAGAGPLHPARLLRPQTSSDCAAGERASSRPGGGVGVQRACGQGSRRGQVQRGSTARVPGQQGASARPGPGWGAARRPGSPAARRLEAFSVRARPARAPPPRGRPLVLACAPRPWHSRGRRAASGRPASRNGPRAAGNPRRGPGATPRFPSPARDALARWRPTPELQAPPKRPMQVEGHSQGPGDIPALLPGIPIPAAPRPSGLARDPGDRLCWQPRAIGQVRVLRALSAASAQSPALAPARIGLSRSRCAARCR